MITIYSMKTCPDCIYLYDQIKDNNKFKVIDIGEHVKNLKEFLRIRDKSSVFDDAKLNGYAGLPCFVLEDGSVTLKPEDVGLNSRPQQDAKSCSIDKKGC